MNPTPSTPTLSPPILTRDAARALNVPVPHLHALIRPKRMPEPARDSSFRFVWSEADLEAARVALITDRRRREHRQQREVGRGA